METYSQSQVSEVTQDETIKKSDPNKNISNLVDLLSKDSNDGNIIVSDLSINMALSILLEGADNDTKNEL